MNFGYPVFTNSRATIITATNTDATRFDDLPCRLLTIRCRTGSFKILGVNGETLDSDGLTLTAASGAIIQLWATNLNQLGYKANAGSDVLEIIRSW